mgnify:CR=1 FL=1
MNTTMWEQPATQRNVEQLRADGSVRDTVMYSIVRGEWPEVRAQLAYRLQKHGTSC